MTYTNSVRERGKIITFIWIDLSEATYDFTNDPFGQVKLNQMWMLRPNLRDRELAKKWEWALATGGAFAVIGTFAFFDGYEREAMLIAVPFMDGIVSIFIEALEILPGVFAPKLSFEESIRFLPEHLQPLAARAEQLNDLKGSRPADYRGTVPTVLEGEEWYEKENRMLNEIGLMMASRGHWVNRPTIDVGIDGYLAFHLGKRHFAEIPFQAKSGVTHTSPGRKGCERFEIKNRNNIPTWLGYDPLLLLLQAPDGSMRCADLHEALVRTLEPFPGLISIPSVRIATEPFTLRTIEIWAERLRQGYPAGVPKTRYAQMLQTKPN